VLTHLFGDYMQVPPEGMRVPHHGAAVIDIERPYRETVNEI